MSNILLMPFLDESENFVHGFECGQIWVKMNNDEVFDKYLFHTVNQQQVKLMCEHYGYEHSFETYDDTWSCLTAKQIDISNLKN